MDGFPAPIHGRDDELHQIIRLLDAVGDGRSRVALVTGPPGVGRSRLLAEVASAADVRGFTVLADPPAPLDVGALRRDATTRAGAAPGRRHLIVIDDADELAPGTAEALLALVHEAPVPVLLVLSWTVCEAGSELDELLEISVQDRERIPLFPLSPDAVARMAADLLGAEPDAGVLTLCAEAGGNAVLVQALLSGLAEERPTEPGAVPARVQRLVRHRMSRLSPKGRQLVRAVVATDAGCSVERLTTIFGENAVSLLPAFEESVEGGLLSFSADGIDVRYPLIRRVVRSWLPAPLLEALRAEVSGAVAMPPDVLADLPAQEPCPAADPPDEPGPPDRPVPPWEEFSETERAVAIRAARGLTNRQIGRELFLSPHTVNYHLRGIFRKLNLSSRVELAGIAALQHPHCRSMPVT